MAGSAVTEVARGKTIDSDGVIVVQNALELPVRVPAHGAEGIESHVAIGFADVTGPFTQVKLDVWQPGGRFDRHGHAGDQPMGELFWVLVGEATFAYSPPGEAECCVTLRAGGSIYFPPGVEHCAWNFGIGANQVLVLGVREVTHPCDAGKKGTNIPS